MLTRLVYNNRNRYITATAITSWINNYSLYTQSKSLSYRSKMSNTNTNSNTATANNNNTNSNNNRSVRRGAFILLEGLDRSGKSTQCTSLAEYYKSHYKPLNPIVLPTAMTATAVAAANNNNTLIEPILTESSTILMRFPNRTSTIGAMCDSYLRSVSELDDRVIHLLFSANRWEQHREIEQRLLAGQLIICDRYSYSGIAFSSAKGLDRNWCYQPERGLIKPDRTYYLTVTPETQSLRGGFGAERYEKAEIQKKVAEQFNLLKDDSWSIIDANESIDKVFNQLVSETDKLIQTVYEQPLKYFE